MAERVGAGGRIIGVDIAAPLLELAKLRGRGLSQVSFLQADAQKLILPDRGAEGIFLRFGVMSFTDPLLAFANFRKILKPTGGLTFICWRALEANQLGLLPLRATGLEAMADHTPFSFADDGFLRTMLRAAGFADVTVQASDMPVSSGNLDAMAKVLLRVGPHGRILRENPRLKQDAERKLRRVLADYEIDGTVAIVAATWIVSARPGMGIHT